MEHMHTNLIEKMSHLRVIYVIVSLSILFGLSSCSKEEPIEPKYGNPSTSPINCNCGMIIDDPIIYPNYYLTVSNNCTGNNQTFSVSYSVWFNGNIGENICFNNIQSW